MAENKNLQWLLPYLFSKQEAKAKAKKPLQSVEPEESVQPEEMTPIPPKPTPKPGEKEFMGPVYSPKPGEPEFEGPIYFDENVPTISARDYSKDIEVPDWIIETLGKKTGTNDDEQQYAAKMLEYYQKKAAGKLGFTTENILQGLSNIEGVLAALAGARVAARGAKNYGMGQGLMQSLSLAASPSQNIAAPEFTTKFVPEARQEAEAKNYQQQIRQQAAENIKTKKPEVDYMSTKPYGYQVLPVSPAVEKGSKLEEIIQDVIGASTQLPTPPRNYNVGSWIQKMLGRTVDPNSYISHPANFGKAVEILRGYYPQLKNFPDVDVAKAFSNLTGIPESEFLRTIPIDVTEGESSVYYADLPGRQTEKIQISKPSAVTSQRYPEYAIKSHAGHEFTHGYTAKSRAGTRGQMSALYDPVIQNEFDNYKGPILKTSDVYTLAEVQPFIYGPFRRFAAFNSIRPILIRNNADIEKFANEVLTNKQLYRDYLDFAQGELGFDAGGTEIVIKHLLQKLTNSPDKKKVQDELLKVIKAEEDQEKKKKKRA